MLILTNDEIEALLVMKECIDVLEQCYVDLAHGEALNSIRGENLSPCGQSDAHYLFKHMGGTWPARRIHVLRINSEIVSYPTVKALPRRVKLPMAEGRWVGLMQIYSTESGELLAMFPDGVAQRMRVGASSAIAARFLARPDTSRLGLIGCGWQAGAQLTAMLAVRPISEVKVYSLHKDTRDTFASEMSRKLGVEIRAVDTAAECIRDVDVIVAATSSMVPVIDPTWLTQGMHLSCIRTEEVNSQVLARCDRAVVHVKDDRQVDPVIIPGTPSVRSHTLNFKSQHGDSFDAAGSWSTFPDLVDLVAGSRSGRADAMEITCFINNVGLGLQFAAIGALILDKARELGIGRELLKEWFSEDVHP